MTRIYAVTVIERIRVPQDGKDPLDTERGVTKSVAVEGDAEAAIAKAKKLILAEAKTAKEQGKGEYETTGIEVQSVVLQGVAE